MDKNVKVLCKGSLEEFIELAGGDLEDVTQDDSGIMIEVDKEYSDGD